MSARSGITCGLLLVAAWHADAQAGLRVVVPAERELAAGPVHLGDLALVEGDDLALLRRLVHLPLGPAPMPGERVSLTREQLAAAVQRRLGAVQGLRWEGAAVARIGVAAPVLAVRRGEWARLQAGVGLVQADLRVEVLQDGRPGDRVLVRHAAGGPAVRGVVVQPGVLELLP